MDKAESAGDKIKRFYANRLQCRTIKVMNVFYQYFQEKCILRSRIKFISFSKGSGFFLADIYMYISKILYFQK